MAPVIYMADISEFQSNIDAPTYLKYHKSLICRVHNGYRADNMMPVRINYLRQYKFKALGWYQYFVDDKDPQWQANEFIEIVGSLRVNEFAICDCESGSGSQVNRVKEWFSVVDKWANMGSTLYSGLSFLNTNLGGTDTWKGHPIWVAAYGQSEPQVPHNLWQYTDHAHYGAITPSYCDSNIHHGTDDDFIHGMRHARGGK